MVRNFACGVLRAGIPRRDDRVPPASRQGSVIRARCASAQRSSRSPLEPRWRGSRCGRRPSLGCAASVPRFVYFFAHGINFPSAQAGASRRSRASAGAAAGTVRLPDDGRSAALIGAWIGASLQRHRLPTRVHGDRLRAGLDVTALAAHLATAASAPRRSAASSATQQDSARVVVGYAAYESRTVADSRTHPVQDPSGETSYEIPHPRAARDCRRARPDPRRLRRQRQGSRRQGRSRSEGSRRQGQAAAKKAADTTADAAKAEAAATPPSDADATRPPTATSRTPPSPQAPAHGACARRSAEEVTRQFAAREKTPATAGVFLCGARKCVNRTSAPHGARSSASAGRHCSQSCSARERGRSNTEAPSRAQWT